MPALADSQPPAAHARHASFAWSQCCPTLQVPQGSANPARCPSPSPPRSIAPALAHARGALPGACMNALCTCVLQALGGRGSAPQLHLGPAPPARYERSNSSVVQGSSGAGEVGCGCGHPVRQGQRWVSRAGAGAAEK